MTVLAIILFLLVLPYLSLLVLVDVGMFLPDSRKRRKGPLPSVTVIIPAHNEEERLPGTLASLSGQEYGGPLEFVVVDDRSTDATPAVIAEAARRDARFRRVSVREPSRRFSPKVNAVNTGIRASDGEVIITSDADCEYPAGWISELVDHFADGVVMVAGYLETTRTGTARKAVQRFETIDWLSLMLTSRSLARYGWLVTSSANNQAYLRSAFEEAGGFGSAGRAPSGDEDLLAQRLGRLPGAKTVFASTRPARVLTRPVESVGQLLGQRRRWVSRYHHPMHYTPSYLAGIAALGLSSLALTGSLFLLPFLPELTGPVALLWGLKLALEFFGMTTGAIQFDRPDLRGLPIIHWALLHPFFIAFTVIASFIRPGDWRNRSAGDYRTRLLRRQVEGWRRRLRTFLYRGG